MIYDCAAAALPNCPVHLMAKAGREMPALSVSRWKMIAMSPTTVVATGHGSENPEKPVSSSKISRAQPKSLPPRGATHAWTN